MRIIEYLIDPPVASNWSRSRPRACIATVRPPIPQVRQVHRLLTTLLVPEQAPAKALCLCYHERWEVEETIDETRNQQRLSQQPLRSRSPKLVLQEFYALLAFPLCRPLADACKPPRAPCLDPDHISFTGAIQVLGQAILQSASPFPRSWPSALLKRVAAA